MSVRTADVVAQAEKARVFSLRDAFAAAPVAAGNGGHGAPVGAAAPRLRFLQSPAASATPPARLATPAPSSTPTLSLKFSTPSQPAKAPTNLPAEVLKSLPVTNSIIGKRHTASVASTPTLSHASGASHAASGHASVLAPHAAPAPVARKVYPATAESARADVMRLAAMVDDLQRKLTASQTKATAAERNAAGAAQRATVERNALSNKVGAMQRELATAKDLEEKARIELRAVSNAKFEVDAAKTSMHEQEVMALQQTKAALLETMSSLQREHDGLKTQTEQLVVQAERKRETARSKAEAAAMLEATAAERMSKLRASEEVGHKRLEGVLAEIKHAEQALAQLKATAGAVAEDRKDDDEDKDDKDGKDGKDDKENLSPEPPPDGYDWATVVWSSEDRGRANAGCGCGAYAVPVALLGPTATAAAEDDPARSLACAVEKDLLDNFKANIVSRSTFPYRIDIASMYPVAEDKNGQGGYESVLEKETPQRCKSDKTEEAAE